MSEVGAAGPRHRGRGYVEGRGRPGDPGEQAPSPSGAARAGGADRQPRAARGAARPHSPSAARAPRRSPRWRMQTSSRNGSGGRRRPARARRSAARKRSPHPRPQARPAAQRSAPPGRGGERRKGTSTRFPGRAARAKSSPNKLRRPAGCSERPPPSRGRPAGSAPPHRWLRLQTFTPPSRPRPPALATVSTALPCFRGPTPEMGIPMGKVCKPRPLPAHPRLAGLAAAQRQVQDLAGLSRLPECALWLPSARLSPFPVCLISCPHQVPAG